MDQTIKLPPPIPPRTTTLTNNFQSPYGSYHSSPWSTMTPTYQHNYGNYYNNSSPYGYNGYGSANVLSSMIPSPARGPFETVESVVHAVSSISMLLDSTYNAMAASVRSVFAVGEQISRMKTQFHQLYAALAFSRFLNWFRSNFGWILGYRPTPDLIWTNVIQDQQGKRPPKSPWPLLIYFGFFLGVPYLTWKLSLSEIDEQKNQEDWKSGYGEHYIARPEFDFQTSQPGELAFKVGDTLKIAPKERQPQGLRGWLLASIDGQKSGLVPANRIKILGLKVPSNNADNSFE